MTRKDAAMTRFGLQIPNFSLGVPDGQLFEEVADTALTAERAGFSSVWVMDHFYQLPPLGGPSQPMLEGYTLLGALAARTSTVELGTLVTGVTYRNPAILAKIVTTLDVISSGRALLGIGAAWYDVEHEALGVDFPKVKERMDRLEEAVQICRLMFTGESATFDGRYYRVKEARNLPRPVRPGGIPIMIGGGGEKRTLKLVAQYADMCNVVGDVDMIRHKIDVIQRHCKDVGRDPSEVTITRMATLVITDSDEQTAQTREFLVQAAGAEAASAFNVGREDEIVDQVAELAEAGVDTFIFNMPTSGKDAVQRAGELFASRWG
jgi:F420-dependent oxidoreductase-like protein